jgi:hypothetical protein
MCSVPPHVYRAFKNLASEDARLLVLIQGDQNMNDKIEMPRYIGTEIAQQYGDKVVELLAGINMRFQGEEDPEFTVQQMMQRVVRAQAAQVQPLKHGSHGSQGCLIAGGMLAGTGGVGRAGARRMRDDRSSR